MQFGGRYGFGSVSVRIRCICETALTDGVTLGYIQVTSTISRSGKFGHTFANSGNQDETAPYEPSHQDFHCLLS